MSEPAHGRWFPRFDRSLQGPKLSARGFNRSTHMIFFADGNPSCRNHNIRIVCGGSNCFRYERSVISNLPQIDQFHGGAFKERQQHGAIAVVNRAWKEGS